MRYISGEICNISGNNEWRYEMFPYQIANREELNMQMMKSVKFLIISSNNAKGFLFDV